jgi:hypothetical protein
LYYLFKSNQDAVQIKDRVKKGLPRGVTSLEIGLTGLDDFNTFKLPDDFSKTIMECGANLEVLHLPFNHSFHLENLNKGLADKIIYASDKSNCNNILIHGACSVSTLSGLKYKDVLTSLNYLFNEKPLLNLIVENESLVNNGSWNNCSSAYICESGSFPSDLPSIINKLSKDLECRNLGLALDTCHAINTINVSSSAHGVKKYSMFNYIDAYSPFLKLVHLASSRGPGLGLDHALPFPDSDEPLIEILNGLKSFRYTGAITLEVNEEDYLDAVNCTSLYDRIRELGY